MLRGATLCLLFLSFPQLLRILPGLPFPSIRARRGLRGCLPRPPPSLASPPTTRPPVTSMLAKRVHTFPSLSYGRQIERIKMQGALLTLNFR